MLGTADIRIIRHFQTVGHVAREADVKDSRADTFIFYDIHHAGYQRTRLPRKGAAWLEDDLQMRIAFVEALNDAYQPFDVVIGSRHQVTTTEVDPLYLWEPARELLFNMLKGTLEHVRATLAMTMAMEPTDVTGQRVGQFIS